MELILSPGRLLAALLLVAGYLGLCALVVVRRRRRGRVQGDGNAASGDADLLIAFASQTGMAEQLAWQTAQMLRAGSVPLRMAALEEIDGEALSHCERVLFVVSTCGEGDPPDNATAFVRKVMVQRLRLGKLRYGLLALGDSGYIRYCGFGRTLAQWLRRQGARSLFAPIEVDDGDLDALRRWQAEVALIAGIAAPPAWTEPSSQRWRLVERRLLNAGSPGGHAFHLALEPPAEQALWEAGDIAVIRPRNPPAGVRDCLDALRLPAATTLWVGGQSESLESLLARSHLPVGEAELERLRAMPLRDLPNALQPLPEREYSIGSLPSDARLELLVRQARQADGGLGLASGWLTAHLALDGLVDLRIRTNRAFHPPPAQRPLILIGNGTGMAGLRGHLKARAAAGLRRNWLLFGERTAAHDLFHGDELATWRENGTLERLDLAFSRDQPERIYVQDRLRAAGADLHRWVQEGAAIFVCGSREGMAAAVDATLQDIIGSERLSFMRENHRYCRDVY